MPMDPEPGYWVLTKYEDIKYVSMNPDIFSSQYASGNMLTLALKKIGILNYLNQLLTIC